MFENENIDSQQITVVAIFGAILVVVAIVSLQVLFYRMNKADAALHSGKRPADLAAMMAEQTTQISGYRWVDKQAGVVQVPIKRAMRLTLEDLNARRP